MDINQIQKAFYKKFDIESGDESGEDIWNWIVENCTFKAIPIELLVKPEIAEEIKKRNIKMTKENIENIIYKHLQIPKDSHDLTKIEVFFHNLKKIIEKSAEEISNSAQIAGYSENAGQFEKAHNHAMTVLTQYILTSEEKRAKAEREGNKESQDHYRWKVHFMRTAESTIKENIKMYLEHPELFNK